MKFIPWENVRIYYQMRSDVALCDIEALEVVRQKKILYARKDEIKHEQQENGSFLRNAIKDYLGDDSSEPLDIEYNCYGKPYLVGNPCYFSLSHSGELLVCAISDVEIGADCEKIHDLKFNVAGKVLNEEELTEYENISDEDKNSWMIRMWTIKEGIGKLLGTGIRTPKDLNKDDYLMYTEKIEDYWITVAKNK